MRIAVVGCRHFNNRALFERIMKKYVKHDDLIITSTKCEGADGLARKYAREQGRLILTYEALWNLYGKAAGPIRNKKMASACDVVIAFWDHSSIGTGNMIEEANKMGKKVIIIDIRGKFE